MRLHCCNGIEGGLLFTVVQILFIGSASSQPDQGKQESVSKVVGQCFKDNGFAFVSLYCGFQKIIKIHKAFHGLHKSDEPDCSHVEGDCMADQLHTYDWSNCEEQHLCVQPLQKQHMPPCEGATGNGYLQVEFTCVPGVAKKKPEPENETPPKEPTEVIPTELHNYLETSDPNAMNICANLSRTVKTVKLQSPGYPQFYPPNTDCRCEVNGASGSIVVVVFQALGLGMRKGLCYDWLMWESPGHAKSRMVSCGQLNNRQRAVTSKENQMLLHFHSAASKTLQRLQGFQLQISTEPEGQFAINCFKTHSSVLFSQYSPKPGHSSDTTSAPSGKPRADSRSLSTRLTPALIFTVFFLIIPRV